MKMTKSQLEPFMVLEIEGVEDKPVRLVYLGGNSIFNLDHEISLNFFDEDFTTPCKVFVTSIDYLHVEKCRSLKDFLNPSFAETIWVNEVEEDCDEFNDKEREIYEILKEIFFLMDIK